LTLYRKEIAMKHAFFETVPCALGIGFNAACSISGHRIADNKTGHPRRFITHETVERFTAKLHTSGLPASLFKACANALLVRHGADLLSEDPCASGTQKTFSLATRFGIAEVTPLDHMVCFRFQNPDQSFPWGMSGTNGLWNFHPSGGDLRQLLCEFAEGLEKCCISPVPSVQDQLTVFEILPPEVMKSGAGYYVGCFCVRDGIPAPHSRFSDYFRKPGPAHDWLATALAAGSI
jgi:hypothetical protein